MTGFAPRLLSALSGTLHFTTFYGATGCKLSAPYHVVIIPQRQFHFGFLSPSAQYQLSGVLISFQYNRQLSVQFFRQSLQRTSSCIGSNAPKYACLSPICSSLWQMYSRFSILRNTLLLQINVHCHLPSECPMPFAIRHIPLIGIDIPCVRPMT